ncbi:MAG TPA: ABC transporter ATP-binding protein [Ktedonobacterales bacterium]
MVDVEQLIKRYRGAPSNAVDGVSFAVSAGEFFALLGPNGAGKSTTISILTTILAPTSGSVRIAGIDVAKDPAAVRKRIGIIFQNPSLDLNLTGEENIRLHAMLYGLYPYRPSYRLMPAKYRRQVSEIAATLDMEVDMFRPVRKLSGGMRRKLEIMRSLLHHPQALFLDEPTTGLDVASRRSLWAYLADLRQRQETTIILTTHYLEEAETTDRILILNHGQVVAQGTPTQVKAQFAGEELELDAVDRDALRRELTGLGVRFAENGAFHIALGDRSAHELVRSLSTPLTVMQTQQASLEDVYLRILASE